MRSARGFLFLLTAFALPTGLLRAEQGMLDPNLEPLRPWLGKTWKSDGAKAATDMARVDIARWERALNGKAVRILHSINDGGYGGETIVMWNEKEKSVIYYYFTTAGFMTTGTMKFQDRKIISNEVVSGDAGGVTAVRGTTEMAADGTFRVQTEYEKGGAWQPARDSTYRETPAATVVFK